MLKQFNILASIQHILSNYLMVRFVFFSYLTCSYSNTVNITYKTLGATHQQTQQLMCELYIQQ